MRALLAELAALPPSHTATRALFFLAGTAFSVWSALVPFLKLRTGVDEATLGLLLLCLGGGSLCVMPFSGLLVSRFGCRRVLTLACPMGMLCLPGLAWVDTVWGAALLIALMGALLGTMDVTMNIQSVIVEKSAGRPMLSGFHACYSMGGIAGAGLMSLFLNCRLTPLFSVVILFVLAGIALWKLLPHCLAKATSPTKSCQGRSLPPPYILFLGLLCFIMFMTEGSVLDWSAVYLREISEADAADASLGFAAFAALQTVGRLIGDRLITKIGRMATVLSGGLLCTAVLVILSLGVSQTVAFGAFALLGLATANIIPVFFWAAGNQKLMPVEGAMSAASTCGYLGVLAGPALIGFVAHAATLPLAYAMVGVLTLLVAATSVQFRR